MVFVTSCTVSILSIFSTVKFTLIEELYPLQELLRSSKAIKMHALLKYVPSEIASHNILLLKETKLSNILQLKDCLLKKKNIVEWSSVWSKGMGKDVVGNPSHYFLLNQASSTSLYLRVLLLKSEKNNNAGNNNKKSFSPPIYWINYFIHRGKAYEDP